MSPNKNNSYVIVTVLDQELEFGIEETTTGQYLFNQIICATGIQEADYFGLQYDNQRNQTLWLNLEETIWKQVWKKYICLFTFWGPIIYFIEDRSPSRHKWVFCI